MSPEQSAQRKEKLGGVFWWLLLGLMIASDVGCILSDLLIAGGIAISVTVVGAVVGVPLAVVGWAVGVLLSFNAFMFSTGYYLKNNVPLLEGRKIATWGVSAIIKAFPGLNVIPALTISFVAITLMENTKRGGGVLGKVGKQVLSKTPVGAVAVKVAEKVL